MGERSACDAEKQNQIARIQQMERILNEAQQALRELENITKRYQSMYLGIKELTAYYQSAAWREDYEADERGELPADLLRGVMSEDGIDDFLCDQQRVMAQVRSMTAQFGSWEESGQESWSVQDKIQ